MLGFERYEMLADFWTIDRVSEDFDTETRFAFLETEPAADSDDMIGARIAAGFAILTAAERG